MFLSAALHMETTGSTIEDLRQAVKSAIMSEVGCACALQDQHGATPCKLCNSQYRLRRCIVEYDYATVDSTVFTSADADLLLHDADLYTGSAVRLEAGLPPAADELDCSSRVYSSPCSFMQIAL